MSAVLKATPLLNVCGIVLQTGGKDFDFRKDLYDFY
jgi:hypothetical protein